MGASKLKTTFDLIEYPFRNAIGLTLPMFTSTLIAKRVFSKSKLVSSLDRLQPETAQRGGAR
jgi:hypothetical protein